jgi:gp16 family phage-associated protein
MMHATRTPAQAKAWLESQGKTIKEFADEHGLDRATTYQVLAGTKKGRRGEAHRAAVLLGIKEGTVTSVLKESPNKEDPKS